LQTPGSQPSIQKVITNLYCIIEQIAGLRENKTKWKKYGASPHIFSICKFITLPVGEDTNRNKISEHAAKTPIVQNIKN
jgi:hypothetical protein